MSATVFLSYSRATSTRAARALRDALKQREVTCFLDEEAIPVAGSFPPRLREGLEGARVVVVFADKTYFQRSWCVQEFGLAVAPYRLAVSADRARASQATLAHLVVALPFQGDINALLGHLPPPLAERSWPRSDDVQTLTALVLERLEEVEGSVGDALQQARGASETWDGLARIPTAGSMVEVPGYRAGLPPSLGSGFRGRAEDLWRIFHGLESRRAGGPVRTCAITGGAGIGKSQAAAELAWRYGPRHFQDGVVWVDAADEDAELAVQLHRVLLSFRPNAGPLTDFGQQADQQLEALGERLRNAVPHGKVLWIVDDLPEPRHGRRLHPLKRWCPVSDRVALACTTRRRSVPEADVRVPLRELSIEVAVELLHQPPVDVAALDDKQWQAIARWVGCLPLALRILYTGLAEGFIEPGQLIAQTEEPAVALDDEVEALRDEIGEDYLRGVADALAMSYSGLVTEEPLARPAHLISRLSPIVIPPALMGELAPTRAVARLANRGWLQAERDTEGHATGWRMHRVIASFLRIRSEDPMGELEQLSQWLDRLVEQAEPDTLVPHTLYILDGMVRCSDGNRRRAASGVVSKLAAARLDSTEWATLREVAAGFAVRLGCDADVVRRLEEAPKEDVRGVIGVLGSLRGSEAASGLILQLLADERPYVRQTMTRRAVAHAAAPKILEALLELALREVDPDRAFGELEDKFGDHELWRLASAEWGRELFQDLGRLEYNSTATEWLVRHIQDLDPTDRRVRAVERLSLYLRVQATPLPYRVSTAGIVDLSTGEHLGGRTEFQVPIERDDEPSRYQALVDLALIDPDPTVASRAAAAITWTVGGSLALSAAAHGLLDEGDYPAALALSERILSAHPSFSNAAWWKGLALKGLGRAEDAVRCFGVVLGAEPGFVEARIERAELMLVALGDPEGALRQAELAIEKAPDDARAHFYCAGALLQLNRLDEAELAATRSLELEPDHSACLYYRAMARRLSDTEGALADVAAAVRHGGDTETLEELNALLESWRICRALTPACAGSRPTWATRTVRARCGRRSWPSYWLPETLEPIVGTRPRWSNSNAGPRRRPPLLAPSRSTARTTRLSTTGLWRARRRISSVPWRMPGRRSNSRAERPVCGSCSHSWRTSQKTAEMPVSRSVTH